MFVTDDGLATPTRSTVAVGEHVERLIVASDAAR